MTGSPFPPGMTTPEEDAAWNAASPALFTDLEAPAPDFKGAHYQGAHYQGGQKPKRAMLAGSGLYGDEGEGRRDGDFYPTPPEATHALLSALSDGLGPVVWPLEELDWWECACGDGAICRVLEARTPGRVFASDLASRGHGETGVDFLKAGWPAAADPARTVIITNPPYVRHVCPAFIRHALALRPFGVAMLLKATYFAAAERLRLFREHPPAAVYPLTWRLDFTGAGSPAMETAWFVWRGRQAADAVRWPAYRPLERPADPNTADLLTCGG